MFQSLVNEHLAALEELREHSHQAPLKIPAAIAASPRRPKRWSNELPYRKYGSDLDKRFAHTIAERLREDFLREEFYGGEDEMIEAIDAKDKDDEDFSEVGSYENVEPEPLHNIKAVKRVKGTFQPTAHEVMWEALRMQSKHFHVCGSWHRVQDFLDLARRALIRKGTEEYVVYVEVHDPPPPADHEERAEARQLSREMKRRYAR